MKNPEARLLKKQGIKKLPIKNDEESLVDKVIEISNLDLIKDMEKIMKLFEA